MKRFVLTVLTASIASVAMPAFAYEKGDVLVRFGPTLVSPDDSSDSALGDVVEVRDGSSLGVSVTYMFSDALGVEVLGALPFEHDLDGKGALQGVKIGSTNHLPPTVLLQYAPKLADAFQPYVGAGFNYTTFFREKTTYALDAALGGQSDLSLKDSSGLALELGVDVPLSDGLMFNLSVWNIDIDTTASVSVNGVKAASIDVDIDPWVYMAGLGIRF